MPAHNRQVTNTVTQFSRDKQGKIMTHDVTNHVTSEPCPNRKNCQNSSISWLLSIHLSIEIQCQYEDMTSFHHVRNIWLPHEMPTYGNMTSLQKRRPRAERLSVSVHQCYNRIWFRRSECWQYWLFARGTGLQWPHKHLPHISKQQGPNRHCCLQVGLPACILALQAITYLDPLTRANARAGSVVEVCFACCDCCVCSVVLEYSASWGRPHCKSAFSLWKPTLFTAFGRFFCKDPHHWVTTTSKLLFPHCPTAKFHDVSVSLEDTPIPYK